MINQKKVLALVLARAGSKGLPGKNIKLINGKPLIHWTIVSGLGSKYIDDVVVSTDSEDIARVAIQSGAKVPFLRPTELATDTATSVDAILHAVDWLNEHGHNYETIVLLEPTSPLRDSRDIDTALEIMEQNQANSVVSVCRAESLHPAFMYFVNSSGVLHPYTNQQPNGLRRQDVEPVYFLDGTVYCSCTETLRRKNGFYHEDTYAYIVPKWKSLEIDDEDDFVMVETLMKFRNRKV
jgi:CMP-N,N'-diacetyllegionaminic acid synthase